MIGNRLYQLYLVFFATLIVVFIASFFSIAMNFYRKDGTPDLATAILPFMTMMIAISTLLTLMLMLGPKRRF